MSRSRKGDLRVEATTLWSDLGGLYCLKWSEIGSQDVVSRKW